MFFRKVRCGTTADHIVAHISLLLTNFVKPPDRVLPYSGRISFLYATLATVSGSSSLLNQNCAGCQSWYLQSYKYSGNLRPHHTHSLFPLQLRSGPPSSHPGKSTGKSKGKSITVVIAYLKLPYKTVLDGSCILGKL